jgi:hypothetical protein
MFTGSFNPECIVYYSYRELYICSNADGNAIHPTSELDGLSGGEIVTNSSENSVRPIRAALSG